MAAAGLKLHHFQLSDFSIGRAVFESPGSSVFKARNKSTGEHVALKLRRSPELGSDWLHEAELLSKLQHPALVRCLGIATSPQGTHVVLEWAPGGTLADLLHTLALRRPAAAWRETAALCVLQQLAAAVLYLHQQGIVHRDLKPQNTLITTDWRSNSYLQPSAILVKVADLGISRQVGGGAGHGATQDLHTFHGTPLYISPEMADGHQYSKPVDIWALGVILYECLAGQTPFARPSLRGTLAAISMAHLPRMPPAASPGTAALIMDMLAAKPSRRPSAADVLKRLTALLRLRQDSCPAPVPAPAAAPAPAEGREGDGAAQAEPALAPDMPAAPSTPPRPEAAGSSTPDSTGIAAAAGTPSRTQAAHIAVAAESGIPPVAVRVRVSRRRKQAQQQQHSPPRLLHPAVRRSASPVIRVRRVPQEALPSFAAACPPHAPPTRHPTTPPHSPPDLSAPAATRKSQVPPRPIAMPASQPVYRILPATAVPREGHAPTLNTRQRVTLRRAAGRLERAIAAAAAECMAQFALPQSSAGAVHAAVQAHTASLLGGMRGGLQPGRGALGRLLRDAGVQAFAFTGAALPSGMRHIPAVASSAVHEACHHLLDCLPVHRRGEAAPAPAPPPPAARLRPAFDPMLQREENLQPASPPPVAATAAAASAWGHRSEAAHKRVFKAAQLHMFGAQ